MSKMNGYELSRQWFDFSFENTEKVNPNHTAMYFFAIDLCNKLGWTKNFSFPASMVMTAMGIKSYHTYKKTLDDLVEWGFFEMVQRSKNQYTANIIALSKNNKAQYKALDKATQMHGTKQAQSKDSINKPLNQETKKPLNSRARLFGVPVPDALLDSEDFCKRFESYWAYLEETRNLRPSIYQVEANFRSLIELKKKGNDPLKVIDQTINAGNKSFYPLKEDYGGKDKPDSELTEGEWRRKNGLRAHTKIHYN